MVAVSDSPLADNTQNQMNNNTPGSKPTTSEASARVFSVYEPDTNSFQDRSTSTPSGPTLDIVDAAPIPESEANPQATHPSQPNRGPVFDPTELHSIFPSELPPRPAPKLNFLTRIFKRQPKQTEDIELGTSTASQRAGRRFNEWMTRPLSKRKATTTVAVMLAILLLYFVYVAWEVWRRDKEKEDGKGE